MQPSALPQEPGTAGPGTPDIADYTARAHAMRARAIAHGLNKLASSIVSALRHLVRQVKERARQRAMYRELAALNAETLSDIGITPADFDAIVSGTYEQDSSRISRRATTAIGHQAQRAPDNVAWLHRPQPGIHNTNVESAASPARCA